MNTKTNKELASELGVTPRQISKSRRRGWIWRDGKKVKYIKYWSDGDLSKKKKKKDKLKIA